MRNLFDTAQQNQANSIVVRINENKNKDISNEELNELTVEELGI